MTLGLATSTYGQFTQAPKSAGRSRDAGNTRQLLLEAARQRFARDGYAATTVRDIASDAGVNVALINRYFTSKEGLFESCLTRVVEDLNRSDVEDESIDQMIAYMVDQVVDSVSGEHPLQLLMLLRSSGDEAADRIRRNTLDSFTERMATVAGWRQGKPETEHLVLRAQVALSAALGIVLLRAASQAEPLTSGGMSELTTALDDIFRTLLVSPEKRHA